jgi:predicted GNAT family acetyltransferase
MIHSINWQLEVRPWQGKASNERVALADAPGKEWFGYHDTDGCVTAVAFYSKKGSKVRIGGIFTHPSERGQGHGGALTEWLIARAVDNMATLIDCYSVNPPYWVGLGFTEYGQNAHGVIRLVKIL